MSEPITFYQIDAFADQPFAGNQAAVCLMNRDASDEWLLQVAAEINLSETAFVWKTESGFHLRWCTPAVEVDLYGHATLAAACALWDSGWLSEEQVAQFQSRSGLLEASRQGGLIYLDFPAMPAKTCEADPVVNALGVNAVWTGRNESDFLVQVATPEEVQQAQPDFRTLGEVTDRGAILTAASEDDSIDFVSRFFAPAVGIDEDPVTGSAHVCLSPFWSDRLGRNKLTGFQASERGGRVETVLNGNRVRLGGQAIIVVRGQLFV